MTTLDGPHRLVLYDYPHRHWFLRDGAYDSCAYCGAVRPRATSQRNLRIAFAVLVVAAVWVGIGMGWR